MELPNLTIIVPTRNEAANIANFLRSIPASVALIVVDASQDNTPDLILALRPERTLVIRHPGHIAQARQIGAESAQTPWLLFSDADITFAPDYFRLVSGYKGYDALYGPKLSADDFARTYHWLAQGQQLSQRLGIPAASGSNLLVRRQPFLDIGGFDLGLTCNEDSELGWRIKRKGYRINFAPDLVVYARDHRRLQQGATRKIAHTLARCSLLYFNLMPDRWRSHDWGYWSHLPESSPTSMKYKALAKNKS